MPSSSRWLEALVALLLVLGAPPPTGAACSQRSSDGQADVASLYTALRDRCGCCPDSGRRRCAAMVIGAALREGVPRGCAAVAKHGFVRYCRSVERPGCVREGGCFDPVGGTCASEPCRLGGAECVSPGAVCSATCRTGGAVQWRATCGDPVCGAHREHAGVATCTTAQMLGNACLPPGATCDPGSDCNTLLVCTADDPTHGGLCPISRRRFKDDVRYLGDADRRRLYDELMRFRLATWHYKDVVGDRSHLGFIIDDVEPTPAAGPEQVDLYGYASMAVAAVQTQAREIDALRRDVASLRAELARRPRRHAR